MKLAGRPPGAYACGRSHTTNVGATALFGSLAVSLLAALTSDAPGCDHSARVSQLTNRNQNTGNQDQHYAQDHEVSQREPSAPLRLCGGIITPGLATA
jgi:hypothetical protein